MNTPELDALALEAEAEPVNVNEPAGLPMPAGEEARTEALRILAKQMVRAAGSIITRMVKVTDLEAEEVDELTGAIMGVAAFYDTSTLDPKAAAWIGLGMTALGIAQRRRPIIDLTPEPPADAAASPA